MSRGGLFATWRRCFDVVEFNASVGDEHEDADLKEDDDTPNHSGVDLPGAIPRVEKKVRYVACADDDEVDLHLWQEPHAL